MLINEITSFFKNASKQQIHNLLETKNDTGVKTDILTEFVYLANNDQLWRTVSLDKLLEGKNPQQSVEEKPAIVVKTCPLFDETLDEQIRKSGVKFADRFTSFLNSKKQNPLQPFGSNDKPFIKDGPIGRAIPNETLLHAHLTRDVSVVYSLTGKDPRILKLYGVFTHSDLGTGTPGNIRKQQSMADRLARVS